MNWRLSHWTFAPFVIAPVRKLALGSAFFVAALCLASEVLAQANAPTPLSSPAPTQTSATPLAFDIEVSAPADVQAFLQRHMELQRYSELTDLDATELTRLLAAAHNNVQDLLGTLGYFSPTIQLTVQDTPANPLAQRHILVSVLPGNPVTVSRVTIEFTGAILQDGIGAAPEAGETQRNAIRSGWTLAPAMTFTQSGWDAAKTQALQVLTAQHYPVGRILGSSAEIDPDTHTAALRLTLDSGPLYRLGALQISGLQKFDAALVNRLARLTVGVDYQQNQLLEAQQRLVDSGFFDSVFVSLDTSGDPVNAPVLVQLREARLQKIVLGVGASTDSGLRLSMEHTHNKVPGIDWRAVSKLSLDRDTQSIGTELTAPPDDTGTRWVTSALFQSQAAGSFEVDSQRYRVGRAQTQEQVDRNYYLQYDRAKTSAGGVSTTANALTVNYAWTQRNFSSLPFPSSGYGLGAEIGGGVTLENSRQPYLRARVRWLGVWPLAQQSGLASGRLALRAEGGAVLARAGADLPSTQLFLVGGDTSVRGYALRSIGSELPGGAIAAGRYLTTGSVEWQRPILRDGRPTEWESTVFVDAGAVADTLPEMNAKIGIGAGLRWRSPVGPLQIDLAYGVAVKELRLHLSVGFTF